MNRQNPGRSTCHGVLDLAHVIKTAMLQGHFIKQLMDLHLTRSQQKEMQST